MTLIFTVTPHHSAAALGSGTLEVLGTPALVAFLENAAMHAAASTLSESSTTVGGHIAIDHLRPTAIGDTIAATATLTAQEGRQLTFEVTATDSKGEVARGQHVRYIVDSHRFMEKL